MPRPPVLPVINWKKVFESGKEYRAWLAGGSSPENQKRMESDRKAIKLETRNVGFIGVLTRPVYVIVIAEDWCGDVVRHVPVLQRLADFAPNLRIRYISREQWPEVFVRFLTNGGEAIPKFVFLSYAWVECGNWGPMPEMCRDIIARGKACGDIGTARKKVAALYEADYNRLMVVSELLRLIDIASSQEP